MLLQLASVSGSYVYIGNREFHVYDTKMSRPKYFTPNEVSVHNTMDDLWVSFLGKVYNLTPLCEKYKGILHFILICFTYDITFNIEMSNLTNLATNTTV